MFLAPHIGLNRAGRGVRPLAPAALTFETHIDVMVALALTIAEKD